MEAGIYHYNSTFYQHEKLGGVMVYIWIDTVVSLCIGDQLSSSNGAAGAISDFLDKDGVVSSKEPKMIFVDIRTYVCGRFMI